MAIEVPCRDKGTICMFRTDYGDCGLSCPCNATNGDKIRAMSDEELVDWVMYHDELTKTKGYLSKEDTLKWVQSLSNSLS